MCKQDTRASYPKVARMKGRPANPRKRGEQEDRVNNNICSRSRKNSGTTSPTGLTQGNNGQTNGSSYNANTRSSPTGHLHKRHRCDSKGSTSKSKVTGTSGKRSPVHKSAETTANESGWGSATVSQNNPSSGTTTPVKSTVLTSSCAYAGAKFSDPPSPTVLPRPPMHWFATEISNANSTCSEMTVALKGILKVNA